MRVLTVVLAGLLGSVGPVNSQPAGKPDRPAVSEKAKEVYAAYFERSDLAGVHVGEATTAIDVSALTNEDCMRGLTFPATKAPGGQAFPATVAADQKLKVVAQRNRKKLVHRISKGERKTFVALSEVLFDSTGEYALMDHYVYCGNVCEVSETLLFRRVDGKWRVERKKCGEQVVS